MATTRLNVRRGVGDTTGDMMVVEASENAIDTTTVTDVLNLGGLRTGSPSILNRQFIISGGTPENLGHIGRITQLDANGKATFKPDAPVPIKDGDTLELWRERLQFGGIDAIHRTINKGIRFCQDTAGPEVYMDEFTFNRESPYVSLPSTWAEFGGVEVFTTRSYGWRDVPDEFIDVIPSSRTVRVKGPPSLSYNLMPMRIYGYLRVLEVNDDATPIEMDEQWLVDVVSAEMTLAITRRLTDATSAERRSGFWKGESNTHIPRIVLQRRGMGVRLP